MRLHRQTNVNDPFDNDDGQRATTYSYGDQLLACVESACSARKRQRPGYGSLIEPAYFAKYTDPSTGTWFAYTYPYERHLPQMRR